jgi:hypothetical protein
MILSFVMFLFFTFAFLFNGRLVRKKVWTVIVVLVCMLSLFLAWVSVSSAWTPDPTSYELKFGETEGVFPWAKLSYPLYLSVYHSQTTWIDPVAQGQVQINVFFVNAKITGANGTFWFYGGVFGFMPVYYQFDFIFSNPDTFFDFLLALFTLFNIVGALLGIAVAKMIRRRVGKPPR